MKRLLPFNILLILLTLLGQAQALADEEQVDDGGVVSEVDINDAVVSNWFSAININNMPSGTTHYAFRSPSNNADIGYSVYLPPDYEINTTQTYPVMYWLHGAGGNEILGLWLAALIDNAIKSKQIKPMIVVFPNAGGLTMWCNTFDGSLLSETMFINELIPLIDSKFRTIKDRSGRFLEGFSMGAFGSANFLFKYPAQFSSAVTYGGAYDTATYVITADEFSSAFGSNLEYFNENSPYTAVQRYTENSDLNQYPVRINTNVGSADLTLLLNRSFRTLLFSLAIPSQYTEIYGLGHIAQPYYQAVGIEGVNFHFESTVPNSVPEVTQE